MRGVIAMLVPAILCKEVLERLFAAHLYDEDMFLYNGCPHYNTIPDLTSTENNENIYRWAIVDKDIVIGYFTYLIQPDIDTVCNFGLYSFKRGDSLIGIDIYRKMKELINTYRRVEWRMIGGNPVQKHYDKFCKRYNGRKVILHKVTRSPGGEYCDEHIYEILKNEEFIKEEFGGE